MSECIIGKDPHGARRLWRKKKGPIPPGLYVLHTCDVRLCKNLDHLFLGDQSDNLKDCVAKGRHNLWNKNVTTGPRKLTLEQIKLIKDSVKSTSELVKELKVSWTTIHRIRKSTL